MQIRPPLLRHYFHYYIRSLLHITSITSITHPHNLGILRELCLLSRASTYRWKIIVTCEVTWHHVTGRSRDATVQCTWRIWRRRIRSRRAGPDSEMRLDSSIDPGSSWRFPIKKFQRSSPSQCRRCCLRQHTFGTPPANGFFPQEYVAMKSMAF